MLRKHQPLHLKFIHTVQSSLMHLLAVLSFHPEVNSELVDNYYLEIFATAYQLCNLIVCLHTLYSASLFLSERSVLRMDISSTLSVLDIQLY